MARSYKYTPIGGVTGSNSCKKWRSQENRRYRAYYKNLVRHGKYDDIQGYCGRFGNEWDSPRDGKTRIFQYKYWSCGQYWWYSPYGERRFFCKDGDHWHCNEYYKQFMRK